METYVYDHVEVDIAIGSTAFSKSILLTKGICKGVRFIPFDTTSRDHAININIDDNSGNKIIGKTDFRDFGVTGGGYIANLKPCNFNTHALINVDVVSKSPIGTADFKGQLVFAILEECN